MSTLASTPDARTKLRRAVGIGFTALGALIAVGVAVLFLALTGASRTSSAPGHLAPRYVPLIQQEGPQSMGALRFRREPRPSRGCGCTGDK